MQVLDTGAARKAFDLSLTELGPYSLDFTRSGRYMLLGGQRGHLAMMDWQRSRLVCEVQVSSGIADRAWGRDREAARGKDLGLERAHFCTEAAASAL